MGRQTLTGLASDCSDDSDNNRDAVVLRHRRRSPIATETSDLYVIARLDIDDAAADVYSSEVYCDNHGHDGAFGAHTTANWSRSLPLEPNMSADLDGLDRTLAAAGYCRTGGWRERLTASGAVRYFAQATPRHGQALAGPPGLGSGPAPRNAPRVQDNPGVGGACSVAHRDSNGRFVA